MKGKSDIKAIQSTTTNPNPDYRPPIGATHDKWFVANSDMGRNHILYSDISSFIYQENEMRIIIYMRGNSTPFILGFSNKESLQVAYDILVQNLECNLK